MNESHKPEPASARPSARAGTSGGLRRFSGMAFLPSAAPREPSGLILDFDEARRQRALEAARTRAAQDLVARFFGLAGRAAAR